MDTEARVQPEPKNAKRAKASPAILEGAFGYRRSTSRGLPFVLPGERRRRGIGRRTRPYPIRSFGLALVFKGSGHLMDNQERHIPGQ